MGDKKKKNIIVTALGLIAAGLLGEIGAELWHTFWDGCSDPIGIETEAEINSTDDFEFLNYVHSDVKNYPIVEEDFATFVHPDDKYMGKYPENFFELGAHRKSDNMYIFTTADKTAKLYYYQDDAAKYGIEDDPLALATYFFEEDKKNLINFSDDDLHLSKEVSESGFARTLVMGNSKKDPGIAYFICRACTNDTVYTLEFKYYLVEKISPNEKTPINYLCESLYRGWSISGSTRSIRSYEDFCQDKN